jgi:LysM repeat protein
MDLTKIFCDGYRRRKDKMAILILLLFSLLSACVELPEPVIGITPSSALTPYHTRSPQPSLVVLETPAPLTLPAPSPTPRQHTVRQGEDMGGIAYRYGVTLAALMAANPEVNPSIMSVGTVLVIPPSAGETQSNMPSEPTPVGISLGAVRCYPVSDSSIWCFLFALNNLETAVENPSATVRLVDRNSGQIVSARADAPLNLLLPGGSIPLAAYFPSPAPAIFDAAVELAAALPLADPEQRYLPAQAENVTVNIQPGALAASVNGEIALNEIEGGAASVWVVILALDAAGNVTGLRRWESNAPLSAGQRLPFSAMVYSAGGPINDVKILVEARR